MSIKITVKTKTQGNIEIHSSVNASANDIFANGDDLIGEIRYRLNCLAFVDYKTNEIHIIPKDEIFEIIIEPE